MKPIFLSLVACEVNGRVAVFDKRGHRISKWIPAGDLATKPTKQVMKGIEVELEKRKWAEAVKKWRHQINNAVHRNLLSDWEKKFSTWATSLKFRNKDQKRLRSSMTGRRTKERRTWENAIRLMWQQGNNRFRVCIGGDGWHKWSRSVANNANKRPGGRYGRESRGDNGIAVEDAPENSSVQVCLYRDGPDTGDGIA